VKKERQGGNGGADRNTALKVSGQCPLVLMLKKLVEALGIEESEVTGS
jgi:hypothetical protein